MPNYTLNTSEATMFNPFKKAEANDSPFNDDTKQNAWFDDNDPEISRWNRYLPYVLRVVEIVDANTYKINKDWAFFLPVPPESFSIQVPFAINTNVTLGGIIEEHNAAPIRMITLSGSTGVLPLRGNAPVKQQVNLAEAIFGGTLTSAAQVSSVSRDIGNIVTDQKIPQNILKNADITKSNEQGLTTGYYQFRKLQQFLERYSAFKKTKAGKNFVLAFLNQKDEANYLVSPVSFVMNRVANSPFEYLYSIQFKAWRRVNLTFTGAVVQVTPITQSTNALTKALRVMSESRRLLEKFRNVLTGISTDIDNVLFRPIREAALFTKDLLGSTVTIMDLPTQIVKNAKTAIVANVALNRDRLRVISAFKEKAQQLDDLTNSFSDVSTELGIGETQNSNLGSINKSLNTSTSPIVDKVFESPEDNFEFLNNFKLSELNMQPELLKQTVDERNRVAHLTRLDFEIYRDQVQDFMVDYANSVGAGAATYNRIFSKNAVVTTRTPTDDDFSILFALNNVVLELNRFALSEETSQFVTNRLDFIAGLASRSGIAFTIPKSKFIIPFSYGATLEQLAAKYLGDSNRWHEIAALNGLNAPYVDEVGFDLPLLVNGSGNQVMVSDSTNLFIGQTVFLTSNNATKTQRQITKIQRLSSAQSIITLNGDLDLNRYSILAVAKLSAFLPNTVNSQMTIFIPSDTEPVANDHKFKAIPGVEDFDRLLNEGGIDLLLTSSSDLAVTNDGGCLLATGLNNTIQTARIRLSTKKGTLLRHPGFGLDMAPGQSLADLDTSDLLKSINNLFSDDPIFTGVAGARVSLVGSTMNIGMNIGIKGVDRFLPVNFILNT